MNGEEDEIIPNWLKIINYIISVLSIIVYIFYTNLLLLLKIRNWDYSILIKAYLVFISFCQSLYYFFTPENNTICKLLGSFDIFLDYVKISLSIIILLLNTNDKLKITKNIKVRTIILINFIASFLIPFGFGVIVYFYGEIKKLHGSFCYPTNIHLRFFTYATYGIYYCVFFIITIIILYKIKRESKDEEMKRVNSKDTESVIINNILRLMRSLIFYMLIQAVKMFTFIVFLLNFVCSQYPNRNIFFCKYIQDNRFYEVVSILILNLTIPFFLLAFGFDNINGISLTNRITQNTTMKVLPELQKLSNAQLVDDTNL